MMTLDSTANVFAVTESDVLELYQSRLAVSIALEGERSQSCEAFVCGGKSGNDYWVAAVVFLTLTRRALVYRSGRIGRSKGAFDGAVQEALDFVIPLGFELDSVNLAYSPAMRQVIFKGIRGLHLNGSKGAGKKPLAQESPLPPDAADKVTGSKPAPTVVADTAGAEPVVSPVAAAMPAKPVLAAPAASIAAQDESAAMRSALQQVQQEKKAAEAQVAELTKKLVAATNALQLSEQRQAAAEAANVNLGKDHQAELTALRQELLAMEGRLAAAVADQSRAATDSAGATIRREAELNGEIVGLKTELKAMREETGKAMRQAEQAAAATKQACAEAEKHRKERDALAETTEKERAAARAAQAKLKTELAEAKETFARQEAELTQAKAGAAKEEAAARARLEHLAVELKQVKKELAEALTNSEKSLALVRTERDQVRDELDSLQDDVARIVGEQEEARGLLAERARTAEAEADRLMQSLVDLEAEWSVRAQAQEAAMAERVGVLKGVIEQLWPVDGVPGGVAISPTDLARIAAAPMRVSAPTVSVPAAPAPPAAPPAPRVRRPTPIVILEEFAEPAPLPAPEREAVLPAAPVADAANSSRFDIDTYAPAPDGTDSAPVTISFDDEDWGDLDLSGGEGYGEPVSFHRNPSLAEWVVPAARVHDLQVSVNVQQVAPPGGGPGTYKAFICLVAQDQGREDGCFVVLEQVDAAVKLVYVPEYPAPGKKLLHDAQFFVESIGFILLAVEMGEDNEKRTSALEKCRSFISP